MAKGNPNPNMSGLKPIRKPEDQPTPEQKKAGWAKRQKLWYWIERYQKLSYYEFSSLEKQIRKNPKDFNMFQFAAIRYVLKMSNGDNKILFDNLDRAEGKAMQKTHLEVEDKTGTKQTLKDIKDALEKAKKTD